MPKDILNEKSYPVLSLRKDDIRDLFSGNQKALKLINRLDDSYMEYLANKLCDLILDDGSFWIGLKLLIEAKLKEKE